MKKKYELTPEHRAQLKPWTDKWTNIIRSTKPMDADEREATIAAVNGMYSAAGLPTPKHIVFVSSPLVGNVAAGFAAAIWWLFENSKSPTWDATEAATRAATNAATWAATRAATNAATWAATRAATNAATNAATWDATWDATEAATWDATEAATRAATEAATRAATKAATWAATGAATRAATEAATWDATEAATWDATDAATKAATWAATNAATRAATEAATWDATDAATWDATRDKWVSDLASVIDGNNSRFLVGCARSAMNMSDGGNHWAQYVSFLSFFRHIAKLDLPVYEKFQHYETAAEHSSWRWMHPKFCIISDRPEILKWDDRHRPHCADGPSHRWRDGWEVYYWHGVRVPRQVVMSPEAITTTQIDAESNQEIKRIMIERMGAERYVRDGGAKEAHRDETGILWKRAEEWAAVEVVNGSKEPDGSRKTYFLQVPPEMRTATEAVAWTYGLTEMEYAGIQIRT